MDRAGLVCGAHGARVSQGLRIALLVVVAGYCGLHFAYCRLDTAPWSWDESYLLTYPSRVVAALYDDGPWAALRSWYVHPFNKAPLSMLGTILPMAVFGDGPVSVRVDNLLVVLLGAVAMAGILRAHVDEGTAWAVGVCAMLSPFVLGLARTELAEVYLWTATLFYLRALLRPDALGSARRAAVLGGWFGVGVLAKLSFPLVALGPSLVVFVTWLLAARREGTSRLLLGRTLLAAGVAVAVVFAVCGRSMQRIWKHFRDQGAIGDQYGGSFDRFDLTFLWTYAGEWIAFLGWPWLVLGGLAVVGLVVRHGEARLRGGPVAPLVAGIVVNLTYCYFHPVNDLRFTIGGAACTILLLGLVVGRCLAGAPRSLLAVQSLWLVAFGAVALANSYLDPAHVVLPVPALRQAGILPAPCRDADVRDPILDLVAQQSGRRVGLAGDHRSLNIENLRQRAEARGQPVDFVQIGYLDADLDLDERLRRAGDVGFWVIVTPPDGAPPGLWTTAHARPVRARLEADPSAYERLPVAATFTDGSTVTLHRDRRRGPR